VFDLPQIDVLREVTFFFCRIVEPPRRRIQNQILPLEGGPKIEEEEDQVSDP
jgi:hypothetical protein